VCIEATHGLAVAGVGDQVVKIGSDALRLQEFSATGDAEIVPDQRIDTKTWIACVRSLTDDKGHVTEGRREPLKVTIQQVLRGAGTRQRYPILEPLCLSILAGSTAGKLELRRTQWAHKATALALEQTVP
jgi:hypothetical protein